MGFIVTPLAQKARTKTLIADSDLNLGIYDLIATDVKGDTAEFDEFVGGVGNFSNVLGSGNLDIEGTGNIKGLTTFQNAVQVNGSLHVEGSINNVNIADNGEITTSQGVNGADFNGAKITSTKFNGATINTSGDYSGRKGTFSGAVSGSTINGATITSTKFNGATIASNGNVTAGTYNGVVIKNNGTITVTPSSNILTEVPIAYGNNAYEHGYLTLLPLMGNVKYSGSIKFTTNNVAGISYWNGTRGDLSLNIGGDTTFTFTNIPYLTICTTTFGVNLYGFTLS